MKNIMTSKNENYWHLMPIKVIDWKKYKGRGRPRKEDYKILKPGEGMISWPMQIVKVLSPYRAIVKVSITKID